MQKRGYIYLEWDKQTRFTYQELIKLHRGLSRPESGKLFNLFKLAQSWETDPETQEAFQKILKNCDARQRFPNPPVGFHVT